MSDRVASLGDLSSLQHMLNSFHAATGLSGALLAPDGTLLASSASPEVCSRFHWTDPQTEKQCWQRHDALHPLRPDRPCTNRPCLNELQDCAIPIRVDGQHVATFFFGPFLHAPPDEAWFRRHEDKFGFDSTDYRQALQNVPVLSPERAAALADFLMQVGQNWATQSRERVRLQETRSALQESEERFQGLYRDLETRIQQRTVEVSRAQKRTAQILNAVRVASSSLELDAVLESIAEVMAGAIGAPFCCIFFVDSGRHKMVPRAVGGWQAADYFEGSNKQLLEFELDSLLTEVLERQEPLTCFDFETGPDLAAVTRSPFKSLLALPLRSGERVLGVTVLITDKDYRQYGQDELELVRGIADSVELAVDNAALYEETCRRLKESEGLQRVAQAFLQKIGLEEILEIVCAEAKNLTGARGSAVLLLEEDGWLRVTHHIGKPALPFERVPMQGSLAGRVVHTGEPVRVNLDENGEGDSAALSPDRLRLPGLTSLLTVPLKTDTRVIGALDVMNKPGGFDQEDARIINLFAYQAAIHIEQARLHRQAEQLAVLEERQRLARELHDSVTQALYSVTLYADAARMALANSRWEVAAENLKELRNVTREAMFDMRLLIFELHPPALEKEGLVAALRARLASVEGRAGLPARISAEGEKRLPTHIEQELYRIAQEGLYNAVKHARAHELLVHLHYGEKTVCLELKDDGTGFDPETARQGGGMGLHGIEERVCHLGGTWEIQSAPEKGTTLRVTIPIE